MLPSTSILPTSMSSGNGSRDFDLPTMSSIFILISGPSRRLKATCCSSVSGRALRITPTAHSFIAVLNEEICSSLKGEARSNPFSSEKNISIHLDVGGPGDLGPARDLGADEGGELLGRVGTGLDAELD